MFNKIQIRKFNKAGTEGSDIMISAEGVLPNGEQMSGDNYELGQNMKFYILEVKRTNNKTQIVLSRSHPGLVRRLFEMEVPEIFDGTVEIISISREAGSRTKMAVKTNMQDVDPIGACVGTRGQRVKNIKLSTTLLQRINP